MGTPDYMSPEQVKGDKSIDHRSDIYALGVTLFYAMEGRSPYDTDNESQFDIFNKIVYEELPVLTANSEHTHLIQKACQKDRNLRYQQVEDLFEGPAPVAIVHDREWFQDDERLKNDLRRPVRPREWSINTPLGDVIHAGSDANFTRSRLDYFLLMFPLPHLNNIVRLTNSELTTLNKRETTAGEVLKFFGILILISKFEFSARASLWSNTAPSKYLPAARIGSLTGILVLLVVYVLLVLFYFTFC
jgi:serine/threonine protein kinase